MKSCFIWCQGSSVKRASSDTNGDNETERNEILVLRFGFNKPRGSNPVLHLIPTQRSVIKSAVHWVDKVSPYVHALWKPQSPCRRRGCARLAWNCAHSAVCFSSPCREIKETCFPSLLHLEQISSRFLADCWETLGDYRSLFIACFCPSLSGSCKPGKKSGASHR